MCLRPEEEYTIWWRPLVFAPRSSVLHLAQYVGECKTFREAPNRRDQSGRCFRHPQRRPARRLPDLGVNRGTRPSMHDNPRSCD
jgi:hypothetical protein